MTSLISSSYQKKDIKNQISENPHQKYPYQGSSCSYKIHSQLQNQSDNLNANYLINRLSSVK
jgi:predicted site-specific integrase-resolvase